MGIENEKDDKAFEEKMRAYTEEISKLIVEDRKLNSKRAEVFNALE